MDHRKQAEVLFRDYLFVRAKLADRDFADSNPYLRGNDNLMGRLGEFIAMNFLEAELNTVIEKAESKVNAHYDMRYKEGEWRHVNVKLITGENRNGRTTGITGNWQDLIIIELGKKYEILRIGWVKREDFEKLPKNSKTLVASRGMLNTKGILGQNNKVLTREQLKSQEKFAKLFSFEPKI